MNKALRNINTSIHAYVTLCNENKSNENANRKSISYFRFYKEVEDEQDDSFMQILYENEIVF